MQLCRDLYSSNKGRGLFCFVSAGLMSLGNETSANDTLQQQLYLAKYNS